MTIKVTDLQSVCAGSTVDSVMFAARQSRPHFPKKEVPVKLRPSGLFLFAVLVSALSLVPAPAAAAPPGCFCGGFEQTPQDWAYGSSCAQAESNLWAQAAPYIVCEDLPATCGRQNVLTAGCHWDAYTGQFQVDGYVKFRCWWCE